MKINFSLSQLSLTQKSNVGNYYYTTTRPHAVTSPSAPTPPSTPASRTWLIQN